MFLINSHFDFFVKVQIMKQEKKKRHQSVNIFKEQSGINVKSIPT